MLKVNTSKISVDNFIKKYNMRPRTMFAGCHPYKWSVGSEIHVYPNGEIMVSTEGAGDSVCPTNLDILFDMIKNGDVIKEEEK
jgi:hypothetical protein